VEPPAVVYTQSMQVLDLAATQLSGTPGVDATGDFYDVFPIEIPARGHDAAEDAMWWWVVMGDVCGKGMAAASVAASVRHAAHTVASDALDASAGGPVAPDPALLLHRLHDILMVRTGRRFVTAVAAVLRPDGHGGLVGRLASAGHEPALIRRVGGAVEVVSAGGMLLGLVPRQLAPAVEAASARARSWWCSPTVSPTRGLARVASVSGWNASPTLSPPAAASRCAQSSTWSPPRPWPTAGDSSATTSRSSPSAPASEGGVTGQRSCSAIRSRPFLIIWP
jgi:hypothetical protein